MNTFSDQTLNENSNLSRIEPASKQIEKIYLSDDGRRAIRAAPRLFAAHAVSATKLGWIASGVMLPFDAAVLISFLPADF